MSPEEVAFEEPQISAEEQAQIEISSQEDAEQFRCHDLHKVGQPLKYVILRSLSLNKQVVVIPEYYELRDCDNVIGYQSVGTSAVIGSYGDPVSSTLVVLGTRQRGG